MLISLGKMLVNVFVIETGVGLESFVLQVFPPKVENVVKTKFTFANGEERIVAKSRYFMIENRSLPVLVTLISLNTHDSKVSQKLIHIISYQFRLYPRTKKILKLDLFSNNKFQIENLVLSATDEKKNSLEIGLLSHTSQSVTFQIIPEIEGNVSIIPKVSNNKNITMIVN